MKLSLEAGFTLLHGGWQCETDLVESTRWAGSRVIDFFIGSVTMTPLNTRLERISDHMIITAEFKVECVKSSDECRFKKDPNFLKPTWITNATWSTLLEEACKEGVESGWQEACFLADSCYGENEEITEQFVVDFTWTVTCSQLTWMFKSACLAALFLIPVGF